jgi:hypothetical protein
MVTESPWGLYCHRGGPALFVPPRCVLPQVSLVSLWQIFSILMMLTSQASMKAEYRSGSILPMYARMGKGMKFCEARPIDRCWCPSHGPPGWIRRWCDHAEQSIDNHFGVLDFYYSTPVGTTLCTARFGILMPQTLLRRLPKATNAFNRLDLYWISPKQPCGVTVQIMKPVWAECPTIQASYPLTA